VPPPWVGPERWISSPAIPGEEVVRTGEVSGITVRERLVREPVAPEPRRDAPVVALTFDDGPGPRTNEVLDILASRGCPATFFVVGSMVRLHPDVVRRELGMGLRVGNHTWSHSFDFPSFDYEHVVAEIRATDEEVGKLGGRMTFFRSPQGFLARPVEDAARDTGHRMMLWSIDPADYTHPAPDVLIARIVGSLKPGAVIVLHDGGGTANTTVAALPALIDAIRTAGYSIVGLT
jgi:chitin deacetylase